MILSIFMHLLDYISADDGQDLDGLPTEGVEITCFQLVFFVITTISLYSNRIWGIIVLHIWLYLVWRYVLTPQLCSDSWCITPENILQYFTFWYFCKKRNMLECVLVYYFTKGSVFQAGWLSLYDLHTIWSTFVCSCEGELVFYFLPDHCFIQYMKC